MNLFSLIFYSATAIALVAVLVAICTRSKTYSYAATVALVIPLIVAYLTGMYRVEGVDFQNYEAYLGSERDLIPDPGYRVLMEIASLVGLKLSEFFLLQGLFTILAIWALSRKFNSDIVVTIAIYMLHSAIVRDFSQSRIALAIAIYYLALVQDRKAAYGVLVAAAVSVHLAVIPLVVSYHWAKLVASPVRGRALLSVAPAFVLLFGVPLLLRVASLLDARVEIYMNWTESLYGSPAESYSVMLLFLLIAGICYQIQRRTGDQVLLVLFIMIVYSAATFYGFRDLSIFASRLANVTAALYPFAIGRAVFLAKQPVQSGQRGLQGISLTFGLLVALLLALIVRPGSFAVLQEVQSALIVQ